MFAKFGQFLLLLCLVLLGTNTGMAADLFLFAQDGGNQVVVVNVQKSFLVDYVLVTILVGGALYAVCKSGTQT